MSDMNKIRIKYGQLEVEFEGSEDFIKSELPELLETVTGLLKAAGTEVADTESGSVLPPSAGTSQPGLTLSTSSIAHKLGFKEGSDLVLAACAHLAFAQAKESFSRAEILKEMKAAKTYFKTSYSSNLSNYIQTLVKSNKLLEGSGGSYALHATTIADLKSKL
ncbi:MAG: hypothetical protein K8R23_20555 [Chthoniobacter sp.]|nr:hypothetical protein [Chthoniobacter sp.]